MSRELVYTAFISLDGVVDSPGGTVEGHRSGGWVLGTEFVPEAFSLKAEELAETTALMFGRRSYEAFAPTWVDSEDHVAYKPLPKYVVSTTLADDAKIDDWGPITILRSDADVAELKQSDGGAIFIHGSAELARRLSEADLIDRYPSFYWNTVSEHLGGAIKYLAMTVSGRQWIANLHHHVLCAENDDRLMGPQR